MHAEYYAQHAGFGLHFEAKVAQELAQFCQSFSPERDGLWLAVTPEVQGSIAIDGTHAATEGAHLRWFITSDSLRGQGIGRQLLQSALAFCDERQYRRVFLWTFAGLDAARHLYEAAGFRLEHESPGDQWGTRVQEQRFELENSSATDGFTPRIACARGCTRP
jgi:GNAT superfamily N-acetyltransferase